MVIVNGTLNPNNQSLNFNIKMVKNMEFKNNISNLGNFGLRLILLNQIYMEYIKNIINREQLNQKYHIFKVKFKEFGNNTLNLDKFCKKVLILKD